MPTSGSVEADMRLYRFTISQRNAAACGRFKPGAAGAETSHLLASAIRMNESLPRLRCKPRHLTAFFGVGDGQIVTIQILLDTLQAKTSAAVH